MRKHLLNLIIIAVVFFPLSAIMFNQWYTKGGVPTQNQLTNISGKITKVWATGKHRDDTRFQLNTSEMYFIYNSISREVDLFQEHATVGSAIDLSFSLSDSHAPIFEENEYHTVYAVKFPGRWERTYAQIKSEFERNAKFSIWLAGAFFFAPIYFFAKIIRISGKNTSA